MSNKTCKSCVFFNDGVDDQTCHRNAPQPIIVPDGDFADIGCYWPGVCRDDWCGEYQERQ
jgi:hypothetical protein